MLWVTDADNTLWDTNAVFAKAQESLLAAIETLVGVKAVAEDRLEFTREVDQFIAANHHRGLRYPVELLAGSLRFRLEGKSVQDAVTGASRPGGVDGVDAAVVAFTQTASEPPSLRAGVREGIAHLVEHNADIVVATEGSRARIESWLAHLDLARSIELCVEAPKTVDLFRRLASRFGNGESWAIGDQPDRDIEPALLAGFHAIYFEGGFQPKWHDRRIAAAATFSTSDYLAAVRRAITFSLA
jgi:putative hydrolase of the HAD superfamily